MRTLTIEDLNGNVILDLNQNFGADSTTVFGGDTSDMNAVLQYDSIQGMTNIDARYNGDNFITIKCRFASRHDAYDIMYKSGLLSDMSNTRYRLHYNNGTTDFYKTVFVTHVDVAGENAYYWESTLTLFDLYGIWDIDTTQIDSTPAQLLGQMNVTMNPNLMGRNKTSTTTFSSMPESWITPRQNTSEPFAPFQRPIADFTQQGTLRTFPVFLSPLDANFFTGTVYENEMGTVATPRIFTTGDTYARYNIVWNGASAYYQSGFSVFENGTTKVYAEYPANSYNWVDVTGECTISWFDQNGVATTQPVNPNVLSFTNDVQLSVHDTPLWSAWWGWGTNTAVNWHGGNAMRYPIEDQGIAGYYANQALNYYRMDGTTTVNGIVQLFGVNLAGYDNVWLVDGVPWASNGDPLNQTNLTDLSANANWAEQTMNPDGSWSDFTYSSTPPTSVTQWGAPALRASTMGQGVWAYTWTNFPNTTPDFTTVGAYEVVNQDSSQISWKTMSVPSGLTAGTTYGVMFSPQVLDSNSLNTGQITLMTFTPTSTTTGTATYDFTTNTWDTPMTVGWYNLILPRQVGVTLTDVVVRPLGLPSGSTSSFNTVFSASFTAGIKSNTVNIQSVTPTLTGTEHIQSYYAI